MNFDLDEEQGLLKDSVDRLLADHYGFEQRNAHRAAEEGWSRAMWARFADLGLLALGLPEAHGGYGGPVERMIAMEAFGGALVRRALPRDNRARRRRPEARGRGRPGPADPGPHRGEPPSRLRSSRAGGAP